MVVAHHGKIRVVIPEGAIPAQPQRGGQVRFMAAGAFEVLGGGSAGGGKSLMLIWMALGLQYRHTLGRAAFQCRGYRAVLFRREATQLDKLITEAKKYYPGYGGQFVGGRQGEPGPCFEWPEYDSKIFFCHLQHEDDKENHQGQEYQFIGFDELTHFSITQYLYLFSRCRSTIPGIRPVIRSTTNPTGKGLWWVRKRFIDNWPPNTTRWFIADEDPHVNPRGIEVAPGYEGALSRRFVPLWLGENKVLMANDPMYGTRIKQMGKQMERALLGGDWYAFGGDFFVGFDRGRKVIEPFQIPVEWRLMGSLDPGFASPCSFGLTAADLNGNYYRIATYYRGKMGAEKHAENIARFIKECKYTAGRMPETIVSGRDAWAKRDKWAVQDPTDKTFADVFQEHGMLLEPATIDRIVGWWNWKNLFPDRWFVFKGMNEPLLDEMSAAVSDEKDPEDIEGCGNDPEVIDHALDENRYVLMAIAKAMPRQTKKKGWEETFFGKGFYGGNKRWQVGRG